MSDENKKMSWRDKCYYFKTVAFSFYSFARTKPKSLIFVILLGLSSYQYFIDPTLYFYFCKFYNELNNVERLQLWMIATVIVGFIVSYYTTKKNDKEKLRLEIKARQAESVVLYASRMGQCCTEITLFCQSVLNFKDKLNEGGTPDSFVYWSNIFRKQYLDFMEQQRGYRPLANKYLAFIQVHNLNYVSCRKVKEIYAISSLFDATLSSALRFETHFDIVNHDDNLRMYMEFHDSEELRTLQLLAKQNSIKIVTVAGGIASALTHELHTCTYEILKATIKTPKFFMNQQKVSQGEAIIDFVELDKYFKNMD